MVQVKPLLRWWQRTTMNQVAEEEDVEEEESEESEVVVVEEVPHHPPAALVVRVRVVEVPSPLSLLPLLQPTVQKHLEWHLVEVAEESSKSR
jgi:hypothetical protein